jgi:biotin carboxyl carrier protein
MIMRMRLKHQVMMVLEAMKMENELFSPAAGKIVSLQVSGGSSVNAGDLLAVIA